MIGPASGGANIQSSPIKGGTLLVRKMTETDFELHYSVISLVLRAHHPRVDAMALSAPPKTFFVLRTSMYYPDDLIKLGQVITDPHTPQDRLAEPLPLTGPLKPRKVTSSDWSLNLAKADENAVSVFARIVNFLKAEGGTSTSHLDVLKRHGAVLETQYFEISEDPSYVERTAQIAAVRDKLKSIRAAGNTLYLVTGVKIVRWPTEAISEQTDSAGATGKVAAMIDPSGQLETGFSANKMASYELKTKETPDAAFVVAYRLRRLRVSWVHRRLKLQGDQVGAEMSNATKLKLGSDEDSNHEDDDDDWEIEVATVESHDFGPSLPKRYTRFDAIDEEDGSACLVIPLA